MSKPKAVGVHVFAGGFTMGMRKHLDVTAQLEIHGLGKETVEQRLDLPFVMADDWDQWPNWPCDVIFGNPRCTGFSCTTAGYDEMIHGHSAKCTKDIWDLCNYGVRVKNFMGDGARLVIWESVQQAFTVGRPLLDRLRDELFVPRGYRICHLMLNAATFGNAQHRKRYFFVAYRGGVFNVEPPPLLKQHTTVRDVIIPMYHHEARPVNLCRQDAAYDGDSYHRPHGETGKAIPFMLEGECLNRMGKFRPDVLKQASKKLSDTWEDRMSMMPFSMHCLRRLRWDDYCPVLSSSCGQFVHPELDRPLTVGELSALMGWGKIVPAGPKPMFQIAKGICPEVGEWLGRQCVLFLDDHWGADDWESSYDPVSKQWVGNGSYGSVEKMFDMGQYVPDKPEKTWAR